MTVKEGSDFRVLNIETLVINFKHVSKNTIFQVRQLFGQTRNWQLQGLVDGDLLLHPFLHPIYEDLVRDSVLVGDQVEGEEWQASRVAAYGEEVVPHKKALEVV